MSIFKRDNQRRHPREWLPVAAAILDDANSRVGAQAASSTYSSALAAGESEQAATRSWSEHNRRIANLAVRVSPAATRGTGAPAVYEQATREVVVDSDVALPGVDPATVRWSDPSWRGEHRRAVGLVEHEVGHAAHSDTKWFQTWQREGRDVLDFGTILEETRMESQVISDGGDRDALSAVAHELILRDAHIDGGDPWTDALGAALILGRDEAHGGCLPSSSVDPFRDAYAAAHGEAWVHTLDGLLGAYNRTRDRDVPQGSAMADLMREWKTALSAVDDPQEQESGDQSESGDGESQPSGDASPDNQPDTGDAQSGGDDADTGDTGGESTGDAQSPDATPDAPSIRELLNEAAELTDAEQRAAADAAAAQAAEQDAEQTRRITHGTSESAPSEAVAIVKRPVTVEDRKLAAGLRSQFERLALPAVVKTRTREQLPPGRMIGRGAVTRQAQVKSGQVADADLFRQTRRKLTHTPPPVIGVMTDCSGSMRTAQPGVAQLAWALSEAGRAIQARTALVAFGTTARLVDHDPLNVSTAQATHGWENFVEGFKTLDSRLHLTTPSRGARVLIIVTDGGYGQRADGNDHGMVAGAIVRHLERIGVAVVWAAIGCEWKGRNRGINAGTVLHLPVPESSEHVARALTESIESAMRAARFAG